MSGLLGVFQALNSYTRSQAAVMLVDATNLLQVIVAMRLTPEYASELYETHFQKPHEVGREDVKGSYEVRLPSNRYICLP
jgi:hypothetical protein